MRRHNPIFIRETVLHSLTKAGRRNTPFIPIALLDLPFDETKPEMKNPPPC
jgi:hypothetical protein